MQFSGFHGLLLVEGPLGQFQPEFEKYIRKPQTLITAYISSLPDSTLDLLLVLDGVLQQLY